MRRFELKVPPVAQCLAAAVAMWLVTRLAPAGTFSFSGQLLLASMLLLAAGLVGLASVGHFRRAGTTVNPLSPERASRLVSGGVYCLSRNPMYLALLLALLAWGAWLGNAIALLVVPVFVYSMDRLQIAPEERALEALFGEAYMAYRRKVRRWL